MHKFQSGRHGSMTPCLNETLILHYVTIFYVLQASPYILSNIWHAAHSQTSVTVCYYSILFQASIFFSPIFVFHFFLFFPSFFQTSSFLVLSFTSVRFRVGKACTFLPLHMRFVGCDLNLKSVVSSLPQLGLVFARQVVNEWFDTTGDKHV